MRYKAYDSGCKCKSFDGMNRRSFLKTTAAAGILAALPSQAVTEDEKQKIAAWTQRLWDKGERCIYRGEALKEIAMPMGGIGAGQVYLTGKGRLDRWQLFNNFNGNAHAAGAYFGVWACTEGQSPVARLLQEGDGAGLPGMPSVAFSGEYPFAWIDYENGDSGLPVQVRLEAYSPLIPLNETDSGLPVVVFRFTVANLKSVPVSASVLATQPNLVGWDGYAPLVNTAFEEFMGNRNDPGSNLVHLCTAEGKQHCMSIPIHLATNDEHAAWSLRQCGNVTVHQDPTLSKLEEQVTAVYWLGDLQDGLPEQTLDKALDRVADGATMVLAGLERAPILYAADPRAKRIRRKTLETWERGDYAGWTLEGEAFGSAPADGTLPGQQAVSGYHGKRLVNTFFNSDGTTGRAISKSFRIGHDYLHILIGGGKHKEETCVNLIIGEKVVESATGENTEQLKFVTWDMRPYRRKKAHIEIIDTNQGGWGHILVDDIVFSNSPAPPGQATRAAARLFEALPFTWMETKVSEKSLMLNNETLLPSVIDPTQVIIKRHRTFKGFHLRPDSEVILAAEDGTPILVKRRIGKGALFFCNGNPKEWAEGAMGTAVLGAVLGLAAGADYTPRTGWSKSAAQYGDMVLMALQETPDVAAQWRDFGALWADFSENGRLNATEMGTSEAGNTWNAALSVPLTLQPGESKDVRFVLCWHFPNRMRTSHYGWGPSRFQEDHRLGNQYAFRFKDALDVAQFMETHWERLERETHLFHDTFYDSTLPHWFLDCVSANMSIVRSPIYVWLEDGTVAGFEGSDSCCPMNCTHVYNYAMAMPYLFPALERNIREIDLLKQMDPERNFIPHRTVLPLTLPRLGDKIGGPEHHALDGELGALLKAYREWRMCGDKSWLDTLWPNIKLVMEHIWREHDVDGDGVIKGEQPNTYDTHLFGSNTFIGTLYLASLRALEEMAKDMEDVAFETQCRTRFEAAREGYDRICWNGEYYFNVFDAPKATPETYEQNNCFGPGCHSDQLLGQWWAHLLGLGYVLPEDHVRQALHAIHQYNWRTSFAGHVQQPRRFANDDEKGLLCCSWPKGGRPKRPILYCDEIWTGIEYEVAAAMLYEGMVEEAFQIIRGARDRYAGYQRNPWSEIECGGHYARAMSSWSLLHAAAGYTYDAAHGSIRFTPRVTPDDFRCFFTAGAAWGTLVTKKDAGKRSIRVEAKSGEVAVHSIVIPNEGDLVKIPGKTGVTSNVIDGNSLKITFSPPYVINPGSPLDITL
ncbi:MAG TPA: GH116 family glycosyl hydrolase [Candidatus Hydrogenedentes bacterium]|nr:GH116 family glycosyl hydrolase [Candidatus Hydrogenedentota bacterium]